MMSVTPIEPAVPSGAQRAVIGILTLFWAAIALWMIAAPQHWWASVPGVDHSGPYNVHFVRDVGMAYATVAICMGVGLARPPLLVPMLVVPVVWLSLHGGLHIWDIAASRLPLEHLLLDLPGVFAPAIIHLLLLIWVWRSPTLVSQESSAID